MAYGDDPTWLIVTKVLVGTGLLFLGVIAFVGLLWFSPLIAGALLLANLH